MDEPNTPVLRQDERRLEIYVDGVLEASELYGVNRVPDSILTLIHASAKRQAEEEFAPRSTVEQGR